MAKPSKAPDAGGEQSPLAPEPLAIPPAAKPTLDDLEAAEHAEAMADKAAREAKPAPAAKLVASPAKPAPASAAAPGKRRYRIWQQGTLERDGVTYRPGETIELSEEQAASIGPTVVSEE